MSSAARKHQHPLTSDPSVVDPSGDPSVVDPSGDPLIGNADGTEYATRGARGHRASRPHLRIVSPLRAEKAGRGVFALIVLSTLTVGMLAVLLINTSLAQGAFTITALKVERGDLLQQEQTLTEAVAALAAPESLEQKARGLGMVPSENPVFLDVTTGKVLGNPKPAPGTRSSMPRLLTPADATVSEGVDNGLAGLPIAPAGGTDAVGEVDPAAVDAAALQAAQNDAAAQAAENEASAAASAKAAKKSKNPNAESNLWEEATVLDVTKDLPSGDAGLVAVPVP